MLAIALLVAGCNTNTRFSINSQSSAIIDEWRDSYGGPDVEGWTTAITHSDWKILWKSLGLEPPASFRDGLVGVGIFLGIQQSGGFGIRIDSQENENGKFVVRYSKVEPGPNAIVTMAFTAPYVIWTIIDPGVEVIVEKTIP